MNLDQFVSTYDGRFIDVDKAYGPQCWDLVELYAEQVLAVPKEPWAITLGPNEDAYEAWTVFDAHMQRNFDKIGVGQQQRGDINVYGPKPGYPEGHICIELGGGQVFQQNASQAGSPSHTETRATSYLLGALRKKGANMRQVSDENMYWVFRAFAGREPTKAEVTDPNYYNNADVLISTLVNNGFKQNYPPKPAGVQPYSGPQLYIKETS